MKASGEFFLGDIGVDSGGRDDDTKSPVPSWQLLIYVDDLHAVPMRGFGPPTPDASEFNDYGMR